MKAKRVPNPSGCGACGIDQRAHYSQWWTLPVGWHTWQPQTLEQRKARMLARRAVR